MVTILQPSSLLPTSLGPYCSANQRRKQRQISRQRKREQQQFNQSKKGTLSFPKSYPTPLLTDRHTRTQTKLQALDSILQDLETALKNDVKVDVDIFASLLQTCYHLRALDRGMRIHGLIPTNLLRKSVALSSRLLRLYSSFGRMDDAHQVFDEMDRRDMYAFPWNALMAGYAELGLYEDAMALYFQMEEEGVEPDRFTFPRVLKACGGIGSVQLGEAVHRHLVRLGFGKDGFVLNALVDMYAKCGDIVKARRVFDKVDCRDLVSWNSILTGYIRHGLLIEAFEIFRVMIREGFEPDSVAISSILAGGSSLKIGFQVHGWVVRRGIEGELSITNSLIVVYGNHGKLEQANWLFDHMPERDTISWNSIIAAHSKDPRVLQYFEEMESAGALPDAVTFVSLLSACAHMGLVTSGERLFLLMTENYGITPIMEHYACMVNLYGRAGRIDEAYAIIERMKFEAGPSVWGALLYACYLHGNVDMAEIAAQSVFDLEPDNEHNFELLMRVYRDAGRLEDVERVRKMMEDRGLGL